METHTHKTLLHFRLSHVFPPQHTHSRPGPGAREEDPAGIGQTGGKHYVYGIFVAYLVSTVLELDARFGEPEQVQVGNHLFYQV